MQATSPIDGNVIVILDQLLCTMKGCASVNLTELEYAIKYWGVLDHIEVLYLLLSHCLWLGAFQKINVLLGVELYQLCSCSSVWLLQKQV